MRPRRPLGTSSERVECCSAPARFRYERRHAGELIHLDVKKLGRIQDGGGHRVTGRKRTHVGRERKRHLWEYVHVCIDDATRLAYVEVLADEKATTAIGLLRRALAFYAAHGIAVSA